MQRKQECVNQERNYSAAVVLFIFIFSLKLNISQMLTNYTKSIVICLSANSNVLCLLNLEHH